MASCCLLYTSDRKVIPSPKDVPTYDLKPQMSAPEVADECKARIEKMCIRDRYSGY